MNPAQSIAIGFHPDLDGLSICSGIDFNDINVFKRCAFNYSINPSVIYTSSSKVKGYLVRGSEEVEKVLNWDAKVSASVPLIGSGSGSVQSMVKTVNKNSQLRFVFVAETIYNPESPDKNKIELTEEAKALLNNPEKFKEAYGSFFCSAIRKGHLVWIEITLRSSLSETYESFFADGGGSVLFDVLSGSAKASMRNELRLILKNDEKNVNTHLYGGPEFSSYAETLINLLKGDKDYDNVLQSIGQFISSLKLEYKNTKPIRCTLSDYSAWGISNNSLSHQDIVSTLQEIKKLHRVIANELAGMRLLLTDSIANDSYSKDQLKAATSGTAQLKALRQRLYDVQRELTNSNEELVGCETELYEAYYTIKKQLPEVFDFLLQRQGAANDAYTFWHDRDNQAKNIENILYVFKLMLFFNTLNSISAFRCCKEVHIKNELTGTIVDRIDLSNLSPEVISGSPEMYYIFTGSFGDKQRIERLGHAIDNDLVGTFFPLIQDITKQRPPWKDVNFYYTLVFTDVAGRIFEFPFLHINFGFHENGNAGGFEAMISEAAPSNCCTLMTDYDFTLGSTIGDESQASIRMSYKEMNPEFSDRLVVKVRTDNHALNKMLDKDNEFTYTYTNDDMEWLLKNPIQVVDLKSYASAINVLKFSWYSVNQAGSIDSTVHTMDYPFSRKLCVPIIYLKKADA